MNEDFSVLRETMGRLSEHGGEADLHDRMLATSRRITRRNRVVGTAAVAVAIVAIGTPFALAGTRGAAPDPNVATQPSVTFSPAPSVSGSPSATPSSPTSSRSSTSSTPTVQNGCPVTSQVLFDAVEADGGQVKSGDKWRDIECHDGWASAWYLQKVPTGDPGATVFKYSEAAGKWTAVGSGSGDYCTAYLPRGEWSKFAKACDGVDPAAPCPTGNTETVDAIEAGQWAGDVRAGDVFQELACGDKYAVQQLIDGSKKTFVMRWDSGRERWTAIAAGACKAVVKSPYGNPSICP
ncbi:hypothetical protein [Actinoplanes sp. L3-i22]|uniref:hypothetical protein n=1 Tax=Actinoplanes sp. L3-i22 TaxID=2836373 RepID=UPI001C747619|nr:hypothetical protein [Actinoplanes sp. L3-i22]BCY15296.1 hypothetical protein L3i22_103840 [Actinoplanes sp. L3-i22]